ncbi:Glycerol-3-phosphate dehydrogenase [NAD(P)+] [Coccomyxa sp. Obi]|nr:Glycerol-3-phosphate dehydrogenase [NAD(P)+] [Coccomyxa sp. Obi]
MGVEEQQSGLENPPEAGILPEAVVKTLDSGYQDAHAERRASATAASTSSNAPSAFAANGTGVLYPPSERGHIRDSWKHLMRWSRAWRTAGENGTSVMGRLEKVVVFGGGSFGTAMACALARQKSDLNVTLLLRDPYVCKGINEQHVNTRYLKEYVLPSNVVATTSSLEAIQGAQYAIHAVPVQHSRAFLKGIADVLPPDVPIISVSKGLEMGTGKMMSEVIPSALGRRQPAAFLSGPSFAKEIMDLRPTGVVAASKDKKLAREMQCLFASPYLRVNITTDVTGVEICGALKNVLALAAGIVEGLDLGNNAMAALVAQGCAEIRWLAEKMGANSATVSGLSGLGDIMLTCYGSLSRNRSVGVRLGKGEALADILASSSQVAEGVATAGVVVSLARTYRVSLPVLTAVAQVLDGALSPKEAVYEIMNLPQIEES